MVKASPVDGIDFLPVDKKVKYVPKSDDIDKVIAVADPDTQEYLVTIRDTIARVDEVNRLTWDFRFHALRHSGASVMENSNVSIGTIQKILGHENRTTTEIYLPNLGDSERLAMQVFERARQKSHTYSHTNEKST